MCMMIPVLRHLRLELIEIDVNRGLLCHMVSVVMEKHGMLDTLRKEGQGREGIPLCPVFELNPKGGV